MKPARGQRIDVATVEHLGDYRLRLVFSDGNASVVDFEPFLRSAGNPATAAFLDKEKFRTFRLHFGNLVWGDYDLCFPIDDLYRGKLMAEDGPSVVAIRSVAEGAGRYRTAKAGGGTRSRR